MLEIREATQADDAALLALEAASPQGDSTRILLDRTTYFYRPTLFDRGRVMVAVENDELVGVMAYAIKDVWLQGEVVPVAYLYDLRFHPTYRKSMKRGLFTLWQALEKEILEHSARLVYGHVKADNRTAMNIMLKGGAQKTSVFSVCSLPSLPSPGAVPEPVPDPLDAAASVEQRVGQRDLRPQSIVETYRRGLELGYLQGVYRTVRGSSSAQATIWNLTSLYRGRVLRLPIPLRVLGAVLNPLGSVLPLPRIPRVGQPFRYWHCFDVCCTGPSGKRLMGQLLQGLRRLAARNGTDMLTVFHYMDDPLLEPPRFLVQKLMRYHTVARTYNSALPNTPLYLDIRDL